MEHFNCEDISAVLSGLLDDELDAETRRLAEAHLGRCAPCRDTLNAAERADWSVRAFVATGEVWPASLEARILDVIRRRDDSTGGDGLRLPTSTARATTQSSRRFTVLFAWSGWVAAGMAAAAALALIIGRPGPGPALPLENQGGGALAIDEAATSGSATAPILTREDPAAAVTHDDPGDGLGESSLRAPDQLAAATGNENSGAESGLSASASDSPSEPDLNWFVDLTELGLNETRRRLVMARDSAYQGMERGRDILDSFAFAESGRNAPGGAAADVTDASTGEDKTAPESASAPPALAPRSSTVPEDDAGDSLPPGEIERNDPVNPAEEAVYMASVLLDVVRQTEPGASFAELHRDINEVIESDDLLERLALAQNRVGSDTESASTIGQAWTALEWVAGPIEDDELESVQRLMSTSHLPERLETLSASLSR